MLSVARPALRIMRGAVAGSCQPFRGSDAVGTLPVDATIAFTVRLKRDALAVARPDRRTIASGERQSAHRRRAADVVNPDVRLSCIDAVDGHALAIGRDARRLVGDSRHIE